MNSLRLRAAGEVIPSGSPFGGATSLAGPEAAFGLMVITAPAPGQAFHRVNSRWPQGDRRPVPGRADLLAAARAHAGAAAGGPGRCAGQPADTGQDGLGQRRPGSATRDVPGAAPRRES